MLRLSPRFYLGRNYGRALFLTATLQGVSLIIENELHNSIYFIFSCCLAMGLQNSLTSKYSGSVVRTTHLTGASTDLVRGFFWLACCVGGRRWDGRTDGRTGGLTD